jgi:hypothetical protein
VLTKARHWTMLGGSLVTTAWNVLRLWMEGKHLDAEGSFEYIDKQSRTADKGWSSSLGVVRGANNTSP